MACTLSHNFNWTSSASNLCNTKSEVPSILLKRRRLRIPISPSKGKKIIMASLGPQGTKTDQYNEEMQRRMRNPYEYYHDLGMHYTRITPSARAPETMGYFCLSSPARLATKFVFGNVRKTPPYFYSNIFSTPALSSTEISTKKIIVNNLHLLDTLNTLQKRQVSLFVDTLLEWNERMNLTAVTERCAVMERHVEDSLALLPIIENAYSKHCSVIENAELKVVDVGSGAGLPGVILAIARPDWQVTLIESLQKRCCFMEHVVEASGVSNIQIVRMRAEDAGQNPQFREMYDVAVARAVAEMRVLAEYCLPLIRVGGLLVAAKGYDPQEEVENAKEALGLMGAFMLQLCSVASEGPYGQRTAVLCLKDRSTPAKYPRHPGLPAKKPL